MPDSSATIKTRIASITQNIIDNEKIISDLRKIRDDCQARYNAHQTFLGACKWRTWAQDWYCINKSLSHDQIKEVRNLSDQSLSCVRVNNDAISGYEVKNNQLRTDLKQAQGDLTSALEAELSPEQKAIRALASSVDKRKRALIIAGVGIGILVLLFVISRMFFK